MKKFAGVLTFTFAGETRWNLTAVNEAVVDAKGKVTGYGPDMPMVVCPVCGSTQWITFSNNSGVPDGKNIQMQHPGENFTIVKNWEKNNESYALGTKFFADFKVTLANGQTYKVGPGNYFLPAGFEATVVETGCTTGFELVKVELNGESATEPVTVVGGDVVAFTNADEPKEAPKGKINPIANLLETWKVETHDPVYKVESGSREGTLVSKQATAFGNGHTYFAANIVGPHEIANSSPSNAGIGLFFTVEKRADGYYVVLDEKIVSASIGAVGFDAVPSQSDFRAPNHTNISREYGPIRTFVSSGNQGDAPVYTGDGFLYVHFSKIAWSYETTEIVGCKFDKVKSGGTRDLGRSNVSSIVVKNAAGEVVGLTDLLLGTYTVELWIDGALEDTKTVTLTYDGEEARVDFGSIIVDDLGCTVVDCNRCSTHLH